MSEQTTTGSLATAIAAVLAEVHRVPKNGRNDFHKYDYVTESDLVDHLREKLAEQGVAIFPSVIAHEEEQTTERGRASYRATVTLEITMVHGPSGQERSTRWIGQGVDAGDKAFYKAYTGAMKYFLLKTFLISTGDDPERDAPHDRGPRQPPRRDVQVKSARDYVAELRGVLGETSLDASHTEDFLKLLAKRSGVDRLEDAVRPVRALTRKLTAMSATERTDYVSGLLMEAE